ncbi:MAG: metallopeptidase TldD-related protein [Candidatus Kapabacteria bacterium]|nr:metallopeptidase TldD-related protein [Candidatus Kapabacteria bacterium]
MFIINLKWIYAIVLISLSTTASLYSVNDEDILKAMRDEISRSMNNLKLESLQKPYYIEYKLRLRRADRISSNLGKTLESSSTEFAAITVDLRIGDYKFDNTNFFDVGLSFFGSSDDEEGFKNRKVQYEQDYNTLRRELWLATDAAYKQASEIFTKKESTLKSRMRRDTTPDFIKVPPAKNYNKKEYPKFDFNYFEKLVNDLSAVFRNYPDIHKSSVGVEYIPETVYYVNSEGMEYIKSEYQTGVEIAAFTQADDGMPLADFFTSFSLNPVDLPSADSLLRSAKNVAENLTNMRKAPFLEESYSGPVIFEGQAAAEAWAQVFMPNLVAQRNQMTEGGVQQSNRYQSFQTKIGGRVLPEFISVAAKPALPVFVQTPLLGTYKYDDSGVESEDVNLVESGYLRNLLSERIPTRRVKKSNGHSRGGGAMLSNIIISSDKEKSLNSTELKSRMMKLCKDRELPYGIIVRKAANQNLVYTTLYRLAMGGFNIPRGDGAMNLTRAYRIYPDGREELIRGAEISSMSVQNFKDIINTGNNRFAYNYLAPSVISPFMSGGDQYVGVSLITSDILFEDLEIKSPEEDFRKPPILTNPLSTKK